MPSLLYLVLTTFKNAVKEIIRKPGKLALYLFAIVAIVGILILSLFSSETASESRLPLFCLKAIVFAFITLFLVIGVQRGLTSGDVIFDMSDVNLLFTSPVNPRLTLLYGLVKMATVSFLACFFILFQSNTFALVFGVDFGGLLVVFALVVVSMIAQSLLSLVIYSATNGKPRRKRVVRTLTVAVFVPLAVLYGAEYFASGDLFAALKGVAASPSMDLIPVAGWASASSLSFIAGDIAAGLGWLALTLVGCVLLLAFILLSRVDYYEDVLVATETAFEKKRALAEGDMQAATTSARKTKVTKTGLGGAGASTFLYKHVRETFRHNRFGFFGLPTLLMALGWIILSLALREHLDLITILYVLMMLQIFLIGTGFGLKELYMHYLFLVPDPPFKKLIWSNLELVLKAFLESLLVFIIPGIILSANPLVIVGSVLVYTLFVLLLIGINYVSLRWTQVNVSQGLMIGVYFLAIIVLMLPGSAGALAIGLMIGGNTGTLVGLAILGVWELAVALGCFALAKNVLHTVDMPTLKPR